MKISLDFRETKDVRRNVETNIRWFKKVILNVKRN